MLLARRPWEAPSNQVTNTWQAFTDAIRVQQDSKGNYPFKNIALKTLRSRFTAYLGLEQYWAEKVDPDDANNESDTAGTSDADCSPSNEIRNGINDLFEMVRNFNGSKMAARDEQKVREWAEKGQVDEMKARALLHLDSAFDGVVAASKSLLPRSVDDGRVATRADTPSSCTDDNLSRNGTPDTQNPTVTPSRRPNSARKSTPTGILELEKVQRNFQEIQEKKLQSRMEIQKEREKRKLQEAENAKMEQENTRMRLEMQNSQFQANIMMQQQLMQQQQQMQQQMMEFMTRLTSGKAESTIDGNKDKTNSQG
jgi:hypothetical protein